MKLFWKQFWKFAIRRNCSGTVSLELPVLSVIFQRDPNLCFCVDNRVNAGVLFSLGWFPAGGLASISWWYRERWHKCPA